MAEDEPSKGQDEQAPDPQIAAKKKLFFMTAALGAQTLAPGDVTVTPVQPRGLTSRLVRGSGGAPGVVLADQDPSDTIFVFDVDPTDSIMRTDSDPRDPMSRPDPGPPMGPV
jgi:hypothetical protein